MSNILTSAPLFISNLIIFLELLLLFRYAICKGVCLFLDDNILILAPFLINKFIILIFPLITDMCRGDNPLAFN